MFALRQAVPSFRSRTASSVRAFSAASDVITVQLDTPFVGHKLEQYGGAPDQTVETSKEEMVKMFEEMYTMRRMEIAADVLYKSKFIRGFCHLYDGQEAICVGMEAALTHQDSIVTSYRDHCTHLGRGGTILEVMAELMGRADGASKGIGGSMHMYRKETNFYGGNGIVGAQAPLGAGMAFKHKYSGEPNVACALYGDGAANQGQLFEALNIAALWDLPLIYICENNHYGMGTAEWRAAKNPDFYTRGDYVPGLKINGMDSLSVKKGMSFAKAHALANGPIVLEMDTYRYHGHSMSDPGSTYRTREEITTVRQERDPVERMRKRVLEMELITLAEVKEIEKESRKKVDEAVATAKASPLPEDSALFANMYSNSKELGVTVRGTDYQVVTGY